MRRCEDVKIFDRPPLLKEPFAQTVSGKRDRIMKVSAVMLSDRRELSTFFRTTHILIAVSCPCFCVRHTHIYIYILECMYVYIHFLRMSW